MNSFANKGWNSPYFLCIIATLFWGGSIVYGKFLADTVPPFTLSLIRLGLSFAVMLPFIYPSLKREWAAARKQLKLLLLLAVTGVIAFNLLVFLAAHYTTAVNIALLESTTPFFMIILAFFLIKEKMNLNLLLSLILSVAGVLWVMTQGAVEKLLTMQLNIGDLMVLAAVLCWGIYSIYVKKTVGVLSPLSLFGYSTLIATLIMLPASLIELWYVPLGPISAVDWLGIAYLGIFPSIVSFLFWNRALLLIGPSRASIMQNLVPVFGTLFAILLLGEKLTLAHGLGGLLVIAAIFIMRIKKKTAAN